MSDFKLATPADFRYLPTILSHGWCVLPPFSYSDGVLRRIEKLHDREIVRFAVREDADGLRVTTDAALTSDVQREIGGVIGRCLMFDHDLLPFYDLVRDLPEYQWVARAKAGRLLASPTVWEDLAKTLLTTNTTWAMTIGMVSRLVTLGDPAPGGEHCFPTPEQIAALDPEALNQQVRAGYRGAYLHALATALATGALDVEAWRDPALASSEVYKAIKRIKGFGDYAAGAMMRLLFRFDQLGLDSVCRTMYAQRFNGGKPASDREIAAYYAPFGIWGGLAVWMDVMREDLLG
jgi:3-methyladenine DNA glycosylase/8-oxoguanine DNA glycosylase